MIAHSAGEGGNRVTPVSILQLHAAPWWAFAIVIAALSLHVGGGSLGILSGYTAVFALKGAPLHRVFGTVFVVSMLIMAVMGLALSVWIRQTSNIIGGGLAAYLVATAWITVKRQAGTVGHAEIVLFVVALAITGLLVDWAWLAAMSAKGTYQGFRAPFYLVLDFSPRFSPCSISRSYCAAVFPARRASYGTSGACVSHCSSPRPRFSSASRR